MFELLFKDNYVEVMKDETSIARITPRNGQFLVKILKEGYDFTASSVPTALTTIKERMGM